MEPASRTAKVSIGMPVFNGADFIAQALEAIVRQSFRDFVLVICDNASTDDTESIGRRFAAQDSRIRYVRHPRNIGLVENFRFAATQFETPYFAWAAHDDVWDPRYLENLVKILDERPEVVLAFSLFDNIDPEGKVVRRYDIDWNAVWRRHKLGQLVAFVLQDPAETQRANHIYGLIRHDLLLKTDEFFAYEGFAGSDALHLFSLLCRGEFAVHPEVLFHYRVRVAAGWPTGAGVSHLWRRLVGTAAGHRGNLIEVTRKHLYFYLNLARMVLSDATPLPAYQRLALATLATTRGVERIGTQFPRALVAELRRRNRTAA